MLTAAAVVLALAGWGASGPISRVAAHGRAARIPGNGILFGLGPEADGARRGRLARSVRIGMLSSWYTGSADLRWMSGWRDSEIRRDYAAGYALHLIVWSGGAKRELRTRFGTACGLAYPLSGRFLKDIRELARTFRPPAKARLYVTLFSEFQTYACDGNSWGANPQTTAYFEALKRQYRAALTSFHRLARNSRVSIGWGGWQARWDAPATGGGRSLFEHFADVMRRSDFESFEVTGSAAASTDILAMTNALGRYGPVMLAYYKPPEQGAAAQLETVLSPALLRRLIDARMFAFGFMDESFLSSSPGDFATVSRAIAATGCYRCDPAR